MGGRQTARPPATGALPREPRRRTWLQVVAARDGGNAHRGRWAQRRGSGCGARRGTSDDALEERHAAASTPSIEPPAGAAGGASDEHEAEAKKTTRTAAPAAVPAPAVRLAAAPQATAAVAVPSAPLPPQRRRTRRPTQQPRRRRRRPPRRTQRPRPRSWGANGSERAVVALLGGVPAEAGARWPELRRTATPVDHADDDPSAPSRASSAISCLNARSSERLTENACAFELSGWQQQPLHGEPKEWWLRVRVRSTVIVLGSGVHSSVTIVESDARAGRAVASDFARHDEAGYTDVLWREQVLEGRIKIGA